MQRLSANLGFLWPDRPLLERIDAAAAAGFGAVELHWPYDVPAGDVRARCEGHGLDLLAVNTVRGDVAAGDFGLGAVPGREVEFQAAVDQSIRFCVEAGAGAIHCMAGKVQGDRDAARRTFLDNLLAASEKAEPHGLTLLLEPINRFDAPGYFYATSAEGADVIAELRRPNVKLMFDCYHVGREGGDVIAELERFLPVAGHVQIAAVPDRKEPDAGTLDYRAVFAALDRLGYAGWVGCEYKPRAETDAGLGWRDHLGVGSRDRGLQR